MNNREKAKALEDVLELALRTSTESSHRQGLCVYVSYAADKGIIAEEDKGAVYGLIHDLMNSLEQSIQSKHYNSDFSFRYLTEALHIKHDIPFDDHKHMQKVWEEEYRNFIAQLRQDDKPHLHGIMSRDRVWSIIHGWGTVSLQHDRRYPIKVNFDAGPVYSFTRCGRFISSDINPTIYWDEIQFEAPERPRPKLPYLAVDTPIFVRDCRYEIWYKRHFAGFTEDGMVMVWPNGMTSFSIENEDVVPVGWEEWKLPDEE